MFGLVGDPRLLGLSGFASRPNPAASVAAVRACRADIVVRIDINSIVSGNYKALVALPNHPQIRRRPALERGEEGRHGARRRARHREPRRIDITTDIATPMFLQVVPQDQLRRCSARSSRPR
jgi:hypothetical protein